MTCSKLGIGLFCYSCLVITSCSKPNSNPSASAEPTDLPSLRSGGPSKEAGSSVPVDACGLLLFPEIEAQIGSPIVDSKRSATFNGDLRISQCIYVAAQADKSVSLVVTQAAGPTGAGTPGAVAFWRKAFGRYREQDGDEAIAHREVDRVEEEGGRPPRKLSSLGDEAFWTAGSLYTLRGEVFFRISVGGPAAEETKFTLSKALAEIALSRLTPP